MIKYGLTISHFNTDSPVLCITPQILESIPSFVENTGLSLEIKRAFKNAPWVDGITRSQDIHARNIPKYIHITLQKQCKEW